MTIGQFPFPILGMTQGAISPAPAVNPSNPNTLTPGTLPSLPGGLPGAAPTTPQKHLDFHLGPPANPAGPGAGTENAALTQPTAGVSNQQQMQNFLAALHSMYPQGASNNSFMNPASQPPAPTSQPLVPQGTYVNNSAPYNTTYTPTASTTQQPPQPQQPVSGYNQNQVQGAMNQLPNSFNGWSGLPTLSDETQKENIQDKPSLDNFMEQVGSWQYQYKNPELDGKGTFYGPMAQELEKSEVGKSAVLNTPRGKMVDTGRLSLINTSALSLLNKQQDRMQNQIDMLKKQLKLKSK